MQAPISELANNDNQAPLEAALRDHPVNMTQSDDVLLKTLQRYAEAAHGITVEAIIPLQELPEEWPLIEAMFMIPVAKSVADYRRIKDQDNNHWEAHSRNGTRLEFGINPPGTGCR